MLLRPEEIIRGYGWRLLDVEILVSRPGRTVARLATDAGPAVLKIDSDPAAFVPERAAIDRLAKIGLPTPQVVGFHDGYPAHLCMRWIDGEPLTSSSSETAKREVGNVLRRVHAIPAGPPYAGADTFDVWMAGWLNHVLPHFILDGDRVAGLIDLHDVCPGDGLMDLAVIAVGDERLMPDVLAGYGMTESERDTARTLLPFYVFLRRLSAADWNVRFGDPEVTAEMLSLIRQDGTSRVPPAPRA